MAEKLIRIGRVSSVNAANGTVKVTYPDLDDATTGEFPIFSFTDEFKLPSVGTNVLVLHLSYVQSAGVCMGRFWNASNLPPVTSGFQKELGAAFGEAYISYSDGTVTIHADKIVLDGEVSASEDIKAGTVSLKEHKHTDSVSGETTEPIA